MQYLTWDKHPVAENLAGTAGQERDWRVWVERCGCLQHEGNRASRPSGACSDFSRGHSAAAALANTPRRWLRDYTLHSAERRWVGLALTGPCIPSLSHAASRHVLCSVREIADARKGPVGESKKDA